MLPYLIRVTIILKRNYTRIYNEKITRLVFTPLLLLTTSTFLNADDISETLTEAIKSYEAGEYSTAVEDINYALQLIQQKKSEGLASYLPEPLEGWTAKKSESQSAGSAMFGGGIGRQKAIVKYKEERERGEITVVVDKRFLVKIEGSKVSEEELKSYAKAIDFKKLKNLP